jgi:hypothetical protein
MRDIYIKYRFTFYNSIWYLNSIGIARSTFSSNELGYSYVFSHVDVGNVEYYGFNFCFGDTPLRKFIYTYLNKSVDVRQKFTQLLLSFEEYLQWESIEGTPYKYIDNLTSCYGYKTALKPSCSNSALIKNLLNANINFKYRFEFLRNKHKLVLDQETIDAIDKELTQLFPNFCYYTFNNLSHNRSISDKTYKYYDGRPTEIVFKGEKKYIKIQDEDTGLAEPEKHIHRDILKGVVNILTAKLENFIINKA